LNKLFIKARVKNGGMHTQPLKNTFPYIPIVRQTGVSNASTAVPSREGLSGGTDQDRDARYFTVSTAGNTCTGAMVDNPSIFFVRCF